MKCLKSCATYDAWLDAKDWTLENPCNSCDHEQEFGTVGGNDNAGL